ncbi:conserved hypothetical protein [Amycolatopsis mediterranei U32]|uniref:TPR repeat-containing protein n=1 Tax=Amycolatopsis mediterranei (strain U-32) TaxID=749927 RepID=A0A0H3DE34_AMYMU|nr:conserved hypothetical protein [Amycolatopsis mediterranei U32]KDO10793.1 hypothetical protein DV26_10815 [Amycolatopsis mediterranei]KDU86893.1 hypothetical protein DV36_39725 [Amycolatopsis mediterranei]
MTSRSSRLSLRVLTEAEATELIQRITSGYRDQDDTADIAELAGLCARLPLALRIAAERAINRPWLPLRALISELREESALWDELTADDDDESDAIRTVFAWSYRALTTEASRTFRLLGLHPGTAFSLGAAAALTRQSPARTRRILDDLVGAHLLEQPSADRYEFHDLLRMYANDQARAEEDADTALTAARRVLLWYLHGAVAARDQVDNGVLPWTPAALEPGVIPPQFSDRASALAWYRRERETLVRAVRTADDLDQADLTWQLAVALYPIYAEHNHFDDWIETSTTALRVVRRLGNRAAEAEVLESLGKAHTQHFDRQRGIELQSAALRLRRELGDAHGELKSANALGLAQLRTRDLSAARDLFDRAATLADTLGEPYWLAVATNNAANVDLELESFEQAEQLLTAALAQFRRLGVRSGEGDTLRGLSRANRGLNRPAQAYWYIQAAVAIARAEENPAREAFWLLEQGRVQIALGQPAEALETFQRSAALQRQLGDRAREAEALDATGVAYGAMGRPEEAVQSEIAWRRCSRAEALFAPFVTRCPTRRVRPVEGVAGRAADGEEDRPAPEGVRADLVGDGQCAPPCARFGEPAVVRETGADLGVELVGAGDQVRAEVGEPLPEVAEDVGARCLLPDGPGQPRQIRGERGVQVPDALQQPMVPVGVGQHRASHADSHSAHVGSNQFPPSCGTSFTATVTSSPHKVTNCSSGRGGNGPSSAWRFPSACCHLNMRSIETVPAG